MVCDKSRQLFSILTQYAAVMSQKSIEEKVNEIHEYIVGNPIKNIPGIDNIVKSHSIEIAELKRKKADRFEWSKIFKIFKVVKTTGV